MWGIQVNLEAPSTPQNIRNLRSRHTVRDRISHPYKTSGNIVVLYSAFTETGNALKYSEGSGNSGTQGD
jgi:hypothetical protein